MRTTRHSDAPPNAIGFISAMRFFRQSLHPGADFKNAFDHARVLIHRWEVMDRAVPSNPKGSFGSALVGKSRAVLCHER